MSHKIPNKHDIRNTQKNVFSLEDSNTNVFESFEALSKMFNLNILLIYLLGIGNLVRRNRERVSRYTISNALWRIVRPTHCIGCEDIFREGKGKMTWTVNIFRLLHGHKFILPRLWIEFACASVAPLIGRIWVLAWMGSGRFYWLGYGIPNLWFTWIYTWHTNFYGDGRTFWI